MTELKKLKITPELLADRRKKILEAINIIEISWELEELEMLNEEK